MGFLSIDVRINQADVKYLGDWVKAHWQYNRFGVVNQNNSHTFGRFFRATS